VTDQLLERNRRDGGRATSSTTWPHYNTGGVINKRCASATPVGPVPGPILVAISSLHQARQYYADWLLTTSRVRWNTKPVVEQACRVVVRQAGTDGGEGSLISDDAAGNISYPSTRACTGCRTSEGRRRPR
jgi:hypothetical protein